MACRSVNGLEVVCADCRDKITERSFSHMWQRTTEDQGEITCQMQSSEARGTE